MEYVFETLVHFKALTLRLHAAIPALFPLLETLSKISVRNAIRGCQRFSLNLRSVSRTPLFQILIHPWEQKKIASGEIGRAGGWDPTTILLVAKRAASCWRCRGSTRFTGSPCSIFVEDCRQCFQQWEWHWDHCIQSQQGYSEGDWSFKLVCLF